jgi:hypothetical protein
LWDKEGAARSQPQWFDWRKRKARLGRRAPDTRRPQRDRRHRFRFHPWCCRSKRRAPAKVNLRRCHRLNLPARRKLVGLTPPDSLRRSLHHLRHPQWQDRRCLRLLLHFPTRRLLRFQSTRRKRLCPRPVEAIARSERSFPLSLVFPHFPSLPSTPSTLARNGLDFVRVPACEKDSSLWPAHVVLRTAEREERAECAD